MRYNREQDEEEKENVFGKGAPNDAYARYFIGRSYLNPLTAPEAGILLSNVTFEPGCRNNWHIHRAQSGGGQIIICTAGETLAWGKGGLLVQPHCHGSSGRRRLNGVVGAGGRPGL